MSITMQKATDGLYVSDLINDRFQVIQSSAIRTNFFIYDHTKDDNIRGRDGAILHFPTAEAAHDYLNGVVTPAKPAKAAKPAKVQKEPKEPRVKAEKAPRKARVSTAPVVEVRERKERPGSMLSVIRGLIRKGGDDEAVFKELKELHPGATYGLKTVAILRREMGL